MAANEEASQAKNITFSDSENKLFLAIMQNLECDIQFNTAAVAEKCGYKDGSIAKKRWQQLKKAKLGITAANSPAKNSSAKKRKSKEGEDDQEADTTETPGKRGRKSKANKKGGEAKEESAEPVIKGEEAEEGGEE